MRSPGASPAGRSARPPVALPGGRRPPAVTAVAVYSAVADTGMPGAGARLGLVTEGGALVALDLLGPGAVEARAPADPTAAAALDRVRAYLSDPEGPLDVPLRPAGTPFQQRVWGALRALGPGQTTTYGALARALGTSARAVGQACRANPIPLFIPCHRVVAAAGLGGYAGETRGGWLEVKAWLLAHERAAAT